MRLLLSTGLGLVLAAQAHAQTILHVDPSATGLGDGSTWTNAYTDLQTAITNAAAGDEIWVADGTYKPDQGPGQTPGLRTSTFQLKSGVEFYGGFPPGGGDGSFAARDPDPETFGTILSGDLLGDDGADFAGRSENAYHVVTGTGTDATALLDGFIITGANANGSTALNHDRGGGVTCFASSTSVAASPTITRCRFVGNQADQGAAIYVRNSGPAISDCSFVANHSDSWGAVSAAYSIAGYSIHSCHFSDNSMGTYGSGGAIFNYSSSPTITDTHISSSNANFGGGINNSNSSSPIIEGCTIHDCGASLFGGAVYNSGSSPSFTNCDFFRNTAESGAAIYNGTSTSTVTNCRFLNNHAATSSGNGGAIQCSSGSSLIATSSTFSFNKANGSGGAIYGYGSTLVLNGNHYHGNSATWGGALYCGSGTSVTMTNQLFRANRTTQYHGGGAYFSNSAIAMTNCAFVGNFGSRGGGFSISKSTLDAVNCSLQGNKATEGGGAIYTSTPHVTTYVNTILWENDSVGAVDPGLESLFILSQAPAFFNSLVEHYTDAELDASGSNNLDGTNINNAPAFIDAVDPSMAPVDSGDLRLQTGSPVIDQGDGSANPEPYDLAGASRAQGAAIDLGAYEGGHAVTFGVLFPTLDPGGDENANGLSNFGDYAAGRSPLIKDDRPVVTMDGSGPVIRHRTGASDIEILYLKSSDLVTWEQMTEGADYTLGGTQTTGSQTAVTLIPSAGILDEFSMFYRAGFNIMPPP